MSPNFIESGNHNHESFQSLDPNARQQMRQIKIKCFHKKQPAGKHCRRLCLIQSKTKEYPRRGVTCIVLNGKKCNAQYGRNME